MMSHYYQNLKWQSCGRDYFIVSQSELMIGFWMSDKPLVQEQLASSIANLVLLAQRKKFNDPLKDRIASVKTSLDFLQGFWIAIVREWPNIDIHR